MTRTNQALESLYNTMLLQEMTSELVDYVNEHRRELSFPRIFKNPDILRIAIPLENENPTAKELLSVLKQIRDFDSVDAESGEVVRKIKLDPKYGKGEKEQRLKLGTAVSKLKISEEQKKKFLDWLAMYKGELGKMLKGEPEYYIVISRAPIDILRMSDFDGIYSCHSPKYPKGSSYFACAVREAMYGGAIAYLVKKETIEEHQDTLQEDDFFHDEDRGSGEAPEPMARLRIRRLENSKGEDFAIPDLKIYGRNNVPGFVEAVAEFLKTRQPMTKDAFIRKHHTDKWKHIGGSYFDSPITGLVQSYFTGSNYSEFPYVEIHPEQPSESDIRSDIDKLEGDDLVEQCDEIVEQWSDNSERMRVSFDANNDGDGTYIMPYITLTLDVQNMVNLSLEVEIEADKEPQDGDVVNLGDLDSIEDSPIDWNSIYQYLDGNLPRVYIKNFRYTSGFIYLEFEHNIGPVLYDPEDFDFLCSCVYGLEEYIESHESDFRDVLQDAGLNETYDDIKITDEEQYENIQEINNLKYVYHSASNNSINLDEIVIGSANFYNDEFDRMSNSLKESIIKQFGSIFLLSFTTFCAEKYNPPELDDSPTFDNLFEQYHRINFPPNSKEYFLQVANIARCEIRMDVSHFNARYCDFSFFLHGGFVTSKTVEFCKFLDTVTQDIQNLMTLAYVGVFANSHMININVPRNLETLKSLYKKYI